MADKEFMEMLANAPEEDEEETEEDRRMIEEGMEDIRAGRVYPIEEVLKEYGL